MFSASILLFFLCCCCSTVTPIQWTSAPADGAVIKAKIGDNVSLPWNFIRENGEVVLNIEWFFLAPGHDDHVPFAGSIGDQFTMTAKDQFSFVPNAGLMLRSARREDSGVYMVRVTSHDSMGLVDVAERTLKLVVDGPIQSCAAWLTQPEDSASGVRTIYLDMSTPITVYCDQDTDNGGWMVFQRRVDGSVDFQRNWTDYVDGFGDLQKEFWLGLRYLRLLTSRHPYQLRVDLKAFNGTTAFATYSNFSLGDSSDYYRLHFDSYTGGTAGDGLSSNNGFQFTTLDADHDTWAIGNCASDNREGGWWYWMCTLANLNGRYVQSRMPLVEGVWWETFDGTYTLKSAEMKIRPM